MENKYPERKNVRLPHYNYSNPGAYFVTNNMYKESEDIVCTYGISNCSIL